MGRIEKIIKETKVPSTRKSLREEFINMGLKKGDTVLVHSSLSSIGYVLGGGDTVIRALIDVVTEEGTIVMPTHSGDLCDPVFWSNPEVPKEWFELIREELPAFDPKTTKTFGMGEIVECFRNFEGVKRSYHPTVSFAAYGKNKDFVTDNHSLDYSLSDTSPLGRVYDLDGKILLIGVDMERNTSCHLGEYRAGNFEKSKNAAPVIIDGKREFKVFDDIDFRTEMFYFIGEGLEEKGKIKEYKLGNSKTLVMSQRDCVDFSEEFFRNREY